jgi:hypothetical protein
MNKLTQNLLNDGRCSLPLLLLTLHQHRYNGKYSKAARCDGTGIQILSRYNLCI